MSDLVQQRVVHVNCAERQRSLEELNLVRSQILLCTAYRCISHSSSQGSTGTAFFFFFDKASLNGGDVPCWKHILEAFRLARAHFCSTCFTMPSFLGEKKDRGLPGGIGSSSVDKSHSVLQKELTFIANVCNDKIISQGKVTLLFLLTFN